MKQFQAGMGYERGRKHSCTHSELSLITAKMPITHFAFSCQVPAIEIEICNLRQNRASYHFSHGSEKLYGVSGVEICKLVHNHYIAG